MSKDNQWSLTARYIITVISLIAVIAFLIYAREAVVNLVIAAFIAYLINPAVMFLMSRANMKRPVAVNIVYFSSVILLVGVPASLAPIFYDEFRSVVQDLLHLSNQISEILSQPVRFGALVFHLEEWGKNLAQAQNTVLSPLPNEAFRLLETTSVGALWFLVILVSVHVFLSQWPVMRDWMISLAPKPYHEEITELYSRLRRIWMAYLRGQIVLMIVVGVVFTIAWLIMGIPGALVLGVIAGLFTLIPDVGPFIAVVLTAGVTLLEGSTWGPLSDLPNFAVAGSVALVYLVLINLKNFLLRPYIMGRSVHMNEAVVFIVIMIATILEGILGALLVVPVLASVVVIAEYVQRKLLGLSPFADGSSDQFIASPEEIQAAQQRTWRGRRQAARSDSSKPASSSSTDSQPKKAPARRKTTK